MKFTCNDPLRGDKIVQLGEVVYMVLHKPCDDAYFLVSGVVTEKSVQLAYGTNAQDRMALVVDDKSLSLCLSSIEFNASDSDVDQDERLKNIPSLIKGSVVCDLFDNGYQAWEEYGPLMPCIICSPAPNPVGAPMHPGMPTGMMSNVIHRATRRG